MEKLPARGDYGVPKGSTFSLAAPIQELMEMLRSRPSWLMEGWLQTVIPIAMRLRHIAPNLVERL